LIGVVFLGVYARYLLIFLIVSISIGLLVYTANPQILEYKRLIFTLWSLYSVCWLAYVEFGKTPYSQNIRKLIPSKRAAFYLTFVGTMIALCLAFALSVTGEIQNIRNISHTFFYTLVTAAAFSAFFSVAMIKTIDMIGQKHFLDFILGTYHKPVEKDCVVMFLDMVGSSGMAEKLEPKRSMELIGKFIYDCGYIFRVNNGDIINYTGDGLVVLWPLSEANNAMMSANALRKHFASKKTKKDYWQAFGIVPQFRIGIHAGQVVLNQIGEEKLFLGLYGDVVNTAARLEQLNKKVGTNILLSSSVAVNLGHSWRTLLRPVGSLDIRGREEKIKAYTLYSPLNAET
jgi:class 3 adenylate cyclase